MIVIMNDGGVIMEVYNKNRDKNNSMHDEIREQNAKLKGAPLKEKLAYYKEYYLKTTIVAAVIILLVGSIAYSMLTAPSDTAFAAFFYNTTGKPSGTELLDGFVSHLGIDTKEHDAYIDDSMYYTPDSTDINTFMALEKTMAVISTGELDVVAGDEGTFDYFARTECLYDLTTVLPGDLLSKFEDKLYYAKYGEAEILTPVGVYVDDAPKLDQSTYYTGTKPVLGFIVNTKNLDNAIEFLRYIYMENE